MLAGQIPINAFIVQVKSAQSSMSGNATYQELTLAQLGNVNPFPFSRAQISL